MPHTSDTALLVVGETQQGWKTSRNTAPSGTHNNIQNTKFTWKQKYCTVEGKIRAKNIVERTIRDLYGPLRVIYTAPLSQNLWIYPSCVFGICERYENSNLTWSGANFVEREISWSIFPRIVTMMLDAVTKGVIVEKKLLQNVYTAKINLHVSLKKTEKVQSPAPLNELLVWRATKWHETNAWTGN